jgi:hypothetical protein
MRYARRMATTHLVLETRTIVTPGQGPRTYPAGMELDEAQHDVAAIEAAGVPVLPWDPSLAAPLARFRIAVTTNPNASLTAQILPLIWNP